MLFVDAARSGESAPLGSDEWHQYPLLLLLGSVFKSTADASSRIHYRERGHQYLVPVLLAGDVLVEFRVLAADLMGPIADLT